MAWAGRIARVLLLLLITPLVGVANTFADEVVTDIVFLIDISASMQQVQVGQGRTITFQQVIQRLQGFVDAGLPPNSNVTIITFGEQATNVQQIQVKDAEGRKRLQAALGALKAEDQHTYMSQGIWYGLWEVQRLKKEFPSHYRLLFLITDGQNNPPSGKEAPISFDQLRAGIGSQLHLKPYDDFYLWYAHFGDSDPEMQRLTNNWQGERKPFDGDWRIGRFSFDRRTIRLLMQLPGDWVAAFPGKADLDRGETLGVEGYGVDGKQLQLGPVVVPGLPADAQVQVSPQTISLTDKYQQVSLELRGTNIPPGKYTGRVQLKPPPGFVIPSPRFFYLDFQVAQPTVLVEPAEKVSFGAVTPAAKGRAQIVLKPDAAAALLKPTIQAVVQLRETPPGLVIQAEPTTMVLTERQSVRLTAAVERGHGAKPGPVTGKLVLKSSNPYLTFDPAEAPLTLDIQPWVVPLVRSEFFVEPKEDGTFELSLPVKSDALPAGIEAAFSLGVPKPATEGTTTAPQLDLRVTTKAFTAAKHTARINGKIGNQPGKWSYEVPVLSADPLVVFEPTSIHIATAVTKAEVDVIPGDQLDFGTVAPGGESVREIYLSPSEAAAAVATTVSLASEAALPKGASLEIDPPQAVVKGRTTVHVKLRLAADAITIGELKGAIRLKVTDQAVALAHDRLPWQAKTAKAVVDVIPGDKLDFGILEPGQRQTRSLWLAPNEAAAAKKPTVRLDVDGLPAGASVSFKPQTIVVDQKQEVKVTLIAGSELGQQKARLKLSSESPDVELAVSQLAAIYGAETGWIKFDVERLDYLGLLPGDSTPELRLRAAASQGAIGDTVRLAWDFGKLPPGMSVMPSVNQVTISQAGQEVMVPLVLKGAVGGKYDGTVKLTAKSRVLPAELPVRIEVQQRLVEVVDPPRPWRICASRFGKQCVVELPLVTRANQAAAGVRFWLEPAAPLFQLLSAQSRLTFHSRQKSNSFWLFPRQRLSDVFPQSPPLQSRYSSKNRSPH